MHATLKQITLNFNDRELHETSAHAHVIDTQHDGLFFDLALKMQVLKLLFHSSSLKLQTDLRCARKSPSPQPCLYPLIYLICMLSFHFHKSAFLWDLSTSLEHIKDISTWTHVLTCAV